MNEMQLTDIAKFNTFQPVPSLTDIAKFNTFPSLLTIPSSLQYPVHDITKFNTLQVFKQEAQI
jgi:hypothetical protein